MHHLKSNTPPSGGTRHRRPALGGGASYALLLALMVPLSGCATKGDIRDLTVELRELARQQAQALEQLQRASSQNQTALQDSIGGQANQLFEIRGDIVRQLRDISDNLDRLSELTGQNLRGIQALRDQMEAFRVPGRRRPPPADDSVSVSEGGSDDPGGPGDPDPETQFSAGGAESTYNAAVTQFNRGSYTTARQAFQQFLQAYPSHPQAADAHFYLADILVQEDRMDEAIASFLRIAELYPTSTRVPNALYRVGVIHIQQDNEAEAVRVLERVVNSYPGSGAAILARERLDEIR